MKKTFKVFKQQQYFLTDEASSKTRKVFISHLDKMKPLEFLQLISKLDKTYKGILSKNTLSITEKIDGSALRVGQDKDGKAFIESSTSDSMFNVGDFVVRDLSKGYSGEIGKKFDALLKIFKNDAKLQKLLTKYNNGNGIKIIGEILYTPMGLEIFDKTIKFIRITYERENLGTELTFVPFKVTDEYGKPYDNSEEIKKALYSISTSSRKYVPPTLKIDRDIDISIEINKFKDDIIGRYSNLDALLSSRKHIDREMKEIIKQEILEYQKIIAKKIVSYVNSGLFGKDFEGIVIELLDGDVLKIVTDTFKNTKFNHNE